MGVVQMIGRKSVLGLCVLCGLIVSAVAAQGASAISGTTLQTCKPVTPPTGGFTRAHCAKADIGPGGFTHVAVAENTTTEVRGTTINTEGGHIVSKLKATIAGVPVEIQSTLAHIVNGTVTNKLDPTKEHFIEGTSEITFTEPVVTAPAGKGCKIKQVDITAKVKLTSTGQGDSINSTPDEGETFAEFDVEGCTVVALNGNYKVTGSATCVPDGATLNCSHAQITEKNTLKLRGNKAGFEASFTLEGRDPVSDPVGQFTPLSVTTVET
jgi:hypothetical protein